MSNVKCELNLDAVESKIASKIAMYNRKKLSTTQLKQSIYDAIDDIKGEMIVTNENKGLVAQMIYNTSKDWGVVDLSPNFFDPAYLTTLVEARIKNIQLEDPLLEISTEQITNTESIKSRYDVSEDFLNKAYGLAKEVKVSVMSTTNRNLFDACFINRGSFNENFGLVKDNNELNNNIREYQNILFKRITDYIKYIYDTSPELEVSQEMSEWLNGNLYIESNGKYRNSEIYTDKLKSTIQNYLTITDSNQLSELYIKANDSMFSDEERLAAKLRLDAYNANVILTHFDTYLSLVLGKAIEIDQDFNVLSGENKYRISHKTANLATTWRTSDEIVVADEVDEITKLAVSTTPLYKRGSFRPMENKFLHFSDFEHIIGKIKELAGREDVQNLRFTDEWIAQDETREDRSVWNTLSPQTKEFLRGKSLAETINIIRQNPRRYLSSVFELLGNENFYQTFKSYGFFGKSTFTEDEMNKLYSISRGLFNPNLESNSLYSLTRTGSGLDYYSFVAQVSDSIFKINYVQYFKGEKGIKIRTFIDQSINNIERNIKETINNNNSIKLFKNFDEYAAFINLHEEDDFVLFDLPFTYQDQEIIASVGINDGVVRFLSKKTGKIINDYNLLWQDPNTQKWVDSILRLNITKDIDFKNALKTEFGSQNQMAQALLSFASRVVMNQYVSKNKISKLPPNKQQEEVKKIYSNNPPEWNYSLDEVSLIHGSDTDTLATIALAKGNIFGVTTASQVKNGEGNDQSLQSLSRLLGSYRSQWYLQETKPDSATKNCFIHIIPGLFEGVYTAQEYYDPTEGSKPSTEMTVAEMSYAGFVYDFIGGTYVQDSKQWIGNGHALFIPSVNSDKNTIGRIKINLNKTVDINGRQVAFKDLAENERIEVIKRSQGQIYTRQYEAIVNDFQKLDEHIRSLLLEDQEFRIINDFGIYIPSLARTYITNFKEFNNRWYEMVQKANSSEEGKALFKKFSDKWGKTPIEFLKKVTADYNNTNRLNPIELIDQIHFKQNSKMEGYLANNKILINQIAIFNRGYLEGITDPNFNINDYTTSEQFWSLQSKELLQSLIKSNFKVNTTGTEQSELVYLRDNYPDWINQSGDMILAKVKFQGQSITITSSRDLILLMENARRVISTSEPGVVMEGKYEEIRDLINDFTDIQIHPELSKYNQLHFLFSQEFMCSTVGTFLAHPEKSKSDNPIIQQAASFQAQHKRNVSFTAAMHAFLLNTLDGIPDTYNIAVIDDIKDTQASIFGSLSGIKPFDGATFVNPFIVHLENNSLYGARAGITKKQFVHFKNARTGNGGIIKTAGFGLTNDWIKNSPFLQIMMKKMTNHKWLNQDGSDAIVDFTESIFGGKTRFEKFFFKENGKYYQITEIISNGNNKYQRVLQEVDEFGNVKNDVEAVTQPEVTINNNYDLWRYFGGMNSMEVKDGKLQMSESSIRNVVTAMNNTTTTESLESVRKSSPETQADVWQPLKQVDVHYVATAGAVKQGAANINSAEKYTNDEAYDIQRIKMYQSGIQLDKEHHADDAELSLMTQVVSACAAMGYTFEAAAGLYNALRKATDQNTKNALDAFKEYFTTKDGTSLQRVMNEIIIRSLATSNSENFATVIAQELIEKAKEGKEIDFVEDFTLPISDNTIFGKILSTVSSYLTDTGIRQTIPGILSVLTPSYDLFKLYAGRKLESFDDFDTQIEELQAQQAPVYEKGNSNSNISNIELGRYYKVTRLKTYTAQDILNRIISNPNGAESILNSYTDEAQLIKSASPYLGEEIATQLVNANIGKSVDELISILTNAMANQHYKDKFNIWVQRELEDNRNFRDQNIRKLAGQSISQQVLSEPELIRMILQTQESELNKVWARYNIQNAGFTKERLFQLAQSKGIQITPEIIVDEKVPILVPTDYYKLKREVASGTVLNVTENLREGRNLAAYNVRGVTTDGEQFQIWDLDSARALFNIDEIEKKNKKDPVKKEMLLRKIATDLFPDRAIPDINQLKGLVKRQLQFDLCNLSKSTKDVMKAYNTFLETNDGSQEWYDKYARWVNIYLGNPDGSFLNLAGVKATDSRGITRTFTDKTQVNASNFEQIRSIIEKRLTDTTKVWINGKQSIIDRDSIVTQPYELIMPKIFKTKFGLKTFDDLNTIVNDPDFFTKRYLENQKTKVEENQYDIELKKANGNHYYLLTKKQVLNSGNLTKVSNYLTEVIDGVTWRIDDKTKEKLYEITDDFELYQTKVGNEVVEVIVTDKIGEYVKNLSYDQVKLSSNLQNNPKLTTYLVREVLGKSKKRVAKQFFNYVTEGGTNTNNIHQLNKDLHSINSTNYSYYKELAETGNLTNPNIAQCLKIITEQGRAKHSSFLKSLEIVAARIPAQSMQSFMPMKVVAFDNPDINSAFVSTMQILLQGSDFDIDAVSLAAYDIDSNGMIQVWSPYANIQNKELLEESFKLPIPTGDRIGITEFRRDQLIEQANKIEDQEKKEKRLKEIESYPIIESTETGFKALGQFIVKYRPILNIIATDTNNVNVSLNTDTIEQLALLKNFLNEIKNIEIPQTELYQNFANALNTRLGLNLTSNHIESLIAGIIDIAEEHNLYFGNISRRTLSQIINNYSLYSMYSVINDPVNLIQAQTSVDGTTGPLKEVSKNNKAEEDSLTYRTPGNVVNMYESISDNQVGKKGISICATGLKSFFGITQYSNSALNNGTAEEQNRILLGRPDKDGNYKGITIAGKTYYKLANIRAQDINTIKSSQCFNILSEVGYEEDMALILSAMLSLSTDNAKELALAKLNAGTKTLGLYIYGLSIGMDFNVLSGIMMSKVGKVINEVLNSDVFNNKEGFGSLGDSVFKYFEEGPKSTLRTIASKSSNAYDMLKKKLTDTKNVNDSGFYKYLIKFARDRKTNLTQKFQTLENLRNAYFEEDIDKQVYNQLIDAVQTFLYQSSIINANLFVYNDIKTLSKGAEELRTLGQILGLNQGIKTSSGDLIKQINLIERAIYNTTEKLEDIIDVNRFVLDERYRQQCIIDYENKAKHSFNILDIVAKNEHSMGYLQSLAIGNAMDLNSFKYRSLRNLTLELSKRLKYKKEDKLAKGIQNFIGDYTRKRWMRDSDISIVIPAGNKAFTKTGEVITLGEATRIQLGTDWGDATFRMWMENEVIPNLKQGIIGPNISLSKIADNRFIQDLGNNVVTTTTSRNPSIVYSLPINMLPRQDFERSILNQYKSQFNELNKFNYEYNVTSYDIDEDSGNLLERTTPIKENIVNLFTYYAMIANGWRLGEKSMVPILESFMNTGIIKQFHKYEKALDVSDLALTLENINFMDILPYVAPFESPYSSWSNFIQYRNPITRKYQLMTRISSGEAVDEDAIPGRIGKYRNMSRQVDTNYFQTGKIESNTNNISLGNLEVNGKTYSPVVQFDIETGKILSISDAQDGGLLMLDLTQGLDKVRYVKKNGVRDIDVNMLMDLIENQLNPC